MKWLRSLDNDRAVLLKVRAQPGAGRTMVRGEYGEALKIAVAAPPLEGRANAALIAFLARRCGLSCSAVTLEKGAASRDKYFRLEGIGPAEAARRLLAD